MTVALDIVRSYAAPRAVMRRKLADGVRDDRALAYLFAACLLIFVSGLPRLAREAHFAPDVPLDMRVGGALMAWLVFAPLAFYGLAALSRLIARGFGGTGSWFSARLALFWSLLVVSPVWLLYGLVAGLIGHDTAKTAAGLLLAGCFVYIWGAALREAETTTRSAT